MVKFLLLITLGLFFSPALGQRDTQGDCMQGIRTALQNFYFSGGNVFNFWENLCMNELRIASIYAAAEVYYTPEEIAVGSALLDQTCLFRGRVSVIPYSEIKPNLTDEYVTSLPKLTYQDVDVKLVLTEAYLMDQELFELGFKTEVWDILSLSENHNHS